MPGSLDLEVWSLKSVVEVESGGHDDGRGIWVVLEQDQILNCSQCFLFLVSAIISGDDSLRGIFRRVSFDDSPDEEAKGLVSSLMFV